MLRIATGKRCLNHKVSREGDFSLLAVELFEIIGHVLQMKHWIDVLNMHVRGNFE
jgi:hypothetical protein